MIILINGASHSGKTLLAQRILESLNYSVLSLDLLKMGLIRSKMTNLTPYSEDIELEKLLWPIVKEIIKTAIENGQNLIVEGIYIPWDWKESFEKSYLEHIKYLCVIFSEDYILNNKQLILEYSKVIEHRLTNDFDLEKCINDHKKNLEFCLDYGLNYVLVEEKYEINQIVGKALSLLGYK